MERSIFLLGSHPALSAAEIQTVCDRLDIRARADMSLLPSALVMESEEPIDIPSMMAELGGTPIAGRHAAHLSDQSIESLGEALQPLIDMSGKRVRTLAVSALPVNSNPQALRDLRALGIALKRQLGRRGLRILFPSKGTLVSSAQLFHARIPSDGIGILLHDANGARDVYTLTGVQDISRYAEIDRGRPEADPGSGMLPPKLAQMLLNFASVPTGTGIYDPFSGTGTVPLVALLHGHPVVASDVSPTQVERTKKNLEWARTLFEVPASLPSITLVHDIVRHDLTKLPISIGGVVTEGWLGKGRTMSPSPKEATTTITRAAEMMGSMLRHVQSILPSGGSVITTLPSFKVGKRIVRATDATNVFQKGANPIVPSSFQMKPLVPEAWDHELFRGSRGGTLLYGRPDAIVLREIVRFRLT